MTKISIISCFILAANIGSTLAGSLPPLADVHVHYKWSQIEVTSPQQAVEALQRNDVTLAVVFGTPPELVLDLHSTDNVQLVHFYQPYLQPFLKASWFLNKQAPRAVREALASGRYRGVGELHVSDGIGPRMDSEVFNSILQIAADFNAPVNLHTNASSFEYMRRICSKHTRTRFIWAHAGGLQADGVGKLLSQCDNVWVEFSARDHLKSVSGVPVAHEDGRLREGWLALMQAYPNRFMIGSDPIWPVSEIDSWHSADTGWQTVDEVYAYHRRWLKTLPPELAEKVRYQNAVELFKE
ncbi:amidohydrolase family protein [Sulfuriflexus mobilis]|uniref:amidohydrolase family protein n=1 Tax=Sulfuriflexus mobilis TaxID=1811807 RepID=UPI000F82DCDC|nr:TatD family hydrolase [Sulfuriflexus mobilis]